MSETPTDPTPTDPTHAEPNAPRPGETDAPDVVPSLDPDQPSADPQTQPAPAPEGS